MVQQVENDFEGAIFAIARVAVLPRNALIELECLSHL